MKKTVFILFLLYLMASCSSQTQIGERLMSDNVSSEIFVVDWNGNPLCKLELKEQLVTIFISEEENVLYGIDNNEIIYRYNIKDMAYSNKF